MTQPDKKQELSTYFMKLQSFNDITSYEYLQNLIIYLSAKQVIEERKKGLLKDTSVEDMLISTLHTLDYEIVVDEYMEASRNLMPALYDQCSISTIYDEVLELSTSEDGLENCYNFLKLKEFGNSRKTLLTFQCNKQTNFTYDGEDQNENSEIFTTQNVISLFQDGSNYEFEMFNPTANSKQRIGELKKDSEAHGFIGYSNSDLRIQLNRNDPFFINNIVSVSIIDIQKKWSVTFEG